MVSPHSASGDQPVEEHVGDKRSARVPGTSHLYCARVGKAELPSCF